MEGYLFEKRPRDSTRGLFSSGKVFKKRWYMLQGQQLSMYDDIDLKQQKPKGLVKSHTKIVNKVARLRPQVANDEGTPFCFEVVPMGALNQVDTSDNSESKEHLILAAENEESLVTWISALNEASRGDSLVMTLAQHCQLLGLSPAHEGSLPTEAEVTHAYRKAVVKHHPDKPGGNERMFRVVQKSYQAVLTELDRAVNFDRIEFSVVIEKTPEAGIGLRVVEDDSSGEIVVRGIHAKVNIHHLGEGAGGSLLDGDVLIGIGEDHTSSWKFTRVRQRLGDFREPAGSYINLQFRRYVRRNAEDRPTDAAAGASAGSDPSVPASTDAPLGAAGVASPPTAPKGLKSALKGSSGAAGDARPTSPSILGSKAGRRSIALPSAAAMSSTPSIVMGSPDIGIGELALSPISILAGQSQSQQQQQQQQQQQAPQPSGTLLAMQQEIAELRKQALASNNALTAERAKTEQLSAAVKSLGEEVKSRQEAFLQSRQTEQFYKLQVQEMLVAAATSPPTQGGQSELDELNMGIAQVAEKMLNGRSIFASDQTEAYLKGAELTAAQVQADSLQHAQRVAVMATSALDPTASVLQMWQSSGVPAAERLLRLERRLQKAEASLGFGNPAAGFVLPENKLPTQASAGGNPPLFASSRNNADAANNAGAGTVGAAGVTTANASSVGGKTSQPLPRKTMALGFQHHSATHTPVPGSESAVARRTSTKL